MLKQYITLFGLEVFHWYKNLQLKEINEKDFWIKI